MAMHPHDAKPQKDRVQRALFRQKRMDRRIKFICPFGLAEQQGFEPWQPYGSTRFRVFESVGGSWFRSAVMGSRRHFLRLAKVAHQRNLQAKIDHFLRSAVRKASFHTKRQGLYFRCSSVRCSLEYTSAAVAVPAHSRLLCLNAAFPESRGRCVFFCPQTGLKGKPPCQHSASIKTSTTPL